MAVQIIKRKEVRSFEDFLREYRFQEILYNDFKILAKGRRPLRVYREIKLYGYRIDSRLLGMNTVYFFRAGTKAYQATLATGSTQVLLDDIQKLRDAQRFCVAP